MNSQIGDYDMDYIILDLEYHVNILNKQTWESIGNPRLIWYPIQLMLSSQTKVLPIGWLTQVPVEIEWFITYADFKVIDIVDDTNMYPALLGIEWVIDNQTIINFKKRILMFEYSYLWVVAPIDPQEVDRCV